MTYLTHGTRRRRPLAHRAALVLFLLAVAETGYEIAYRLWGAL